MVSLLISVRELIMLRGILYDGQPFVLSFDFDSCNFLRILTLQRFMRSNVVVEYLMEFSERLFSLHQFNGGPGYAVNPGFLEC